MRAIVLDANICPAWTGDADFFGTGVATWTTSRVRLYLAPEILPAEHDDIPDAD